MLRLRAVVRSLTNSNSSGRTRLHEISSGSPIDVDFGILLDERRYRCRCPGIKRKPGPLDEREFSSI